ncbi:hypothetical protein B0T17DRAFT_650314 [Bombardia bombarda]|uniref:Uncharacterized protein n=1 Tax=Bombardia bombarda TaxID=252184 RepID=A0AA40CEG5_9PEZI|nr:hypothetical protein B0T17DRAFT_650314 [Bombardia bombarda]
MVQADHPVFSNSVPPVPGRIEVPLVFHRIGTRSDHRADLDNQMITYLHIDPESGIQVYTSGVAFLRRYGSGRAREADAGTRD